MSNRNNNKKDKQSTTSSRSISWGAKVHTLNTIDAASYHVSSNTSSAQSSSPSTFQIQHVPDLPSSEYAASLLKRIQSEFQIIVQKRGYHITSVTEMCCCGDGYDYLNKGSSSSASTSITKNGKTKKRGRKLRKMPNNVLGYNLCHGRGSSTTHRIHLRLRHPNNHSSFFPYEDIAGTMCHELAHCEIMAHNAKFYKLMDEIMEQYEIFLVRGLVLDSNGFPMGSSEAYTLGGSSNSNSDISSSSSRNGKNAAAKAAQERLERRKKLGFGGSYVLGGGLSYIQDIKRIENNQRTNGFNIYGTKKAITTKKSSSQSRLVSSLQYLPPREAARIAAERRVEERRKNDSKFCLTCDEIIEILDGSSSSDEEDIDDEVEDNGKGEKVKGDVEHESHENEKKLPYIIENKKPKAKRRNRNNNVDVKKEQNEIIELLDDSDDDEGAICVTTRKSKNETSSSSLSNGKNKETKTISSSSSSSSPSSWSCTKCTFNENKLMSLACEVCGNERPSNNEGLTTANTIEKMIRQDFIDNVKAKETEKSKLEFNGFNIYGNDKRSTSTLDHLT